MEHFEMVFKNFLDMQQKTLGIIYDNNPIKSLSLGKETKNEQTINLGISLDDKLCWTKEN